MRRVELRGAEEIVLLDKILGVYKVVGDLVFYVLSGIDENEILLLDVLEAYYRSLTDVLK